LAEPESIAPGLNAVFADTPDLIVDVEVSTGALGVADYKTFNVRSK
jgi:hypothetical protein